MSAFIEDLYSRDNGDEMEEVYGNRYQRITQSIQHGRH